jgi:cell pole-organizing protein PopZ
MRMGDVRNEPSMEDILASIKRIIAEDGAAALNAPRARSAPRGAQPDPVPTPQDDPSGDPPADPVDGNGDDAVLELTDPVPGPPPSLLVSPDAANASRQSLAALSKMVVRPDPDAETPPGNTLEALVRELLRPILKDWLDQNLPELVEGLVAREIARITGKSL